MKAVKRAFTKCFFCVLVLMIFAFWFLLRNVPELSFFFPLVPTSGFGTAISVATARISPTSYVLQVDLCKSQRNGCASLLHARASHSNVKRFDKKCDKFRWLGRTRNELNKGWTSEEWKSRQRWDFWKRVGKRKEEAKQIELTWERMKHRNKQFRLEKIWAGLWSGRQHSRTKLRRCETSRQFL